MKKHADRFRERLFDFAVKHADSRKSIGRWIAETKKASWKTKQDVLMSFPQAKVIGNNRARFEIRHNTYRMIAQINYDEGRVFIRFIGTHGEYDRINPLTI